MEAKKLWNVILQQYIIFYDLYVLLAHLDQWHVNMLMQSWWVQAQVSNDCYGICVDSTMHDEEGLIQIWNQQRFKQTINYRAF